LKRFKNVDGQWKKLATFVDFPINNLDLSPYVLNFEFLTKLDISCQYDLCGMINHYGSLTFGHYISVVKNIYEQQWYKYDDQNRIPIPES
jgi:ubiquitin carboxyl-terminal hydrolase 4/11/15